MDILDALVGGLVGGTMGALVGGLVSLHVQRREHAARLSEQAAAQEHARSMAREERNLSQTTKSGD